MRLDDWWCRYLAATAGVVVVNVDLTVAPRVASPVAQHQCHDVATVTRTRTGCARRAAR